MNERISKSWPVFDCDAHVNDPLAIWDYVSERDKELVRATYWRDDQQAWLNGSFSVMGGGRGHFAPSYNPICIAGPQMNKRILRRLLAMGFLSDEQRAYLEHRGAYDPHARIREMDLMGIDQVLVIPTMVIMYLQYAENSEGVRAFCRAYNDWLKDWCGAVPRRLFGAALIPLQNPEYAAAEIHRIADLGHRVGLIRPIDARGAYPNDIGPPLMVGPPKPMDVILRAFEDTGVCLGMHTFPAGVPGRTAGPGMLGSPGELLSHTGYDNQALSFILEMQTWLAQVLLSGLLDRYPRLKMLAFESNSQWLPALLDTCDRLFKLYANEREVPATRLPSEAFYEQCLISFESDEEPTFRQWKRFENVGIWSSDAYHHDGADAWSAIRLMRKLGVPDAAQQKLMGGNARRFYGIEPETFVTEEPPPIDRPDWFPGGPELEEWAKAVENPRANAKLITEKGWGPLLGGLS